MFNLSGKKIKNTITAMASVVGSQKAEVQESKEDLGVLYILIFYKIAFLP